MKDWSYKCSHCGKKFRKEVELSFHQKRGCKNSKRFQEKCEEITKLRSQVKKLREALERIKADCYLKASENTTILRPHVPSELILSEIYELSRIDKAETEGE